MFRMRQNSRANQKTQQQNPKYNTTITQLKMTQDAIIRHHVLTADWTWHVTISYLCHFNVELLFLLNHEVSFLCSRPHFNAV